ncbi:hypothetical protein DK37_30315 [Halomonas sp. SUBG004]|nr:hypothetical protein DK37_30315 [Halomonas sp. SUBG004]
MDSVIAQATMKQAQGVLDACLNRNRFLTIAAFARELAQLSANVGHAFSEFDDMRQVGVGALDACQLDKAPGVSA